MQCRQNCWHDDPPFVPRTRKTPSVGGRKKAPDLHLNQIIDLKLYDMYFVFKTRIGSIYGFYIYKTVQYGLCNHKTSVGPGVLDGARL